MRLDHEKVRWHRDRLGWTLDTLAEKAEVAKGTVLRAEHGEDVRPSSGRRIAGALGVEISDLIPDRPGAIVPKVESRSSPEPSLPNGLEDERRAEWDAAVRNAHQLREGGQARMEALLATWRRTRNRETLREMGLLLDEALGARIALQSASGHGTHRSVSLGAIPIAKWEEISEADRLYGLLIDTVLAAGLSVRRGPEAHEVKDAA